VIENILTQLGLEPQPPLGASAQESLGCQAGAAALPHGRQGGAARRVGTTRRSMCQVRRVQALQAAASPPRAGPGRRLGPVWGGLGHCWGRL